MGCDFKVGDDVVCVGGDGDTDGMPPLGWTGTVMSVGMSPDVRWPDVVVITINTWPLPPGDYHNALYWRKAQRGSARGLLADRSVREEPKRAPAKKRERVE